MKKHKLKRELTEDQKANAEAWRRARTVTFKLSRMQLKALKYFMDCFAPPFCWSPSEAAQEFLLHELAAEIAPPDRGLSSAMGRTIAQAHDRICDMSDKHIRSLSSFVDASLRKNFPIWKRENEVLEQKVFVKK